MKKKPDANFFQTCSWHESMPNGVLYKWLQDHGRNFNLGWIDLLINRNAIFKPVIKTQLFQLQIELQYIYFFLEVYKILAAVIKNFSLQSAELGEIFIGLVHISFEYIALDAVESIEDEVWIHLRAKCC